MNDNIPQGLWLGLSGVPKGATEQELSEFLKAHYLEIGPECISVKDCGGNATSVIVSLQKDVIVDLFSWALNGDTFNGSALEARLRVSSRRT